MVSHCLPFLLGFAEDKKMPEKRVELRGIWKISARLSDKLDLRSKSKEVILGSKLFLS